MSKTQESSNEPNPAIGKSKVLCTLKDQLPNDWKPWACSYVDLRFKQRMYQYLPRLSNGSIDPIVNLPNVIGGLGLSSVKKEVDSAVMSLSDNHVYLANLLYRGDRDDRMKRALPSIMRDRFARGVNFDEGFVDHLFDFMSKHLEPPPVGVDKTLERFSDYDVIGRDLRGIYNKRRFLGRHGYYGSREIQQLYKRAVLQERLLTEDPSKGWEQSSWPSRRRAYERTLEDLKARKDLEGIFVGGELDDMTNRSNLAERIFLLPFGETKGLMFEEDIFFHRDMNPIDYENLEIKMDRKPVAEILDGMTRLELPVIDSWFQHAETQ
jgi:hypothetical protein